MSKAPLDIQMMRRPMVNRSQRAQTPTGNRATHSGMIFNSGMLHTGGKSHYGAPGDHKDILNFSSAPTPEKTPIFAAGHALSTPLALPSTRLNSPRRTPRSNSPTPQNTSQTGKKYIRPGGHGDVIGFTVVERYGTPDRVTCRSHNATPKDSFLVGLSEKQEKAEPKEKRGRIYLDRPAPFQPDVFKPYQKYLRQKGKVESMPVDHPILGASERLFLSKQPLRQQEAVKCGRMRIEPKANARYDIITGQAL